MVFIHATGVRFSYGLPDYERDDTINRKVFVKKETKRIHKETATQIATGLAINYPLNLFLLYIYIERFGITDPVILGTMVTLVMTIVAYTRIFLLRSYFSKKYK